MATADVLTPRALGLILPSTTFDISDLQNGDGQLSTLRPFERAPVNLYSKPEEVSQYIQSLPQLIEYNARHNPSHLFCIQARKQTNSASFSALELTHLQLRNAVANCSSWLKENVKSLRLPVLGDDGVPVKGPPIALFMESDLGILLHLLALMGLGVPVLLLSARLSPAAIKHLLEKTSSSAVLVSARLSSTAQEALASMDFQTSVTTLHVGLGFDSFTGTSSRSDLEPLCHEHHYINESDRNVLILHSSGTTGLPKPIYVSHRHMVSYTTCNNFLNETEAQGRNVSTLPLYHGFGLVAPALSMGVGKIFCLPAPSTIPNATSTIQLVTAVGAASLMSVPSILEDILLMPDSRGTDILSKLDFVAFGGGALKPSVGTQLAAKGVSLLNHYGTTESGPLSPVFVPKSDYDWRFFRLRPDLKMKLEEIAPNGDERRFKLTTFPFGWPAPFEIQDQLICNPSCPHTDFNAVGRNDDLIVLATGEKVQPQILENLLAGSGLVKTAVTFGDNQFEIGVIVEPVEAPADGAEAAFKDALWPVIVEAGSLMDDFAKISSRDAIIIAPAGAKLPRTDKGSIARREVFAMFEQEIARVYEDLENSSTDFDTTPLTMETLEADIKELIQSRISWKIPSQEWSTDDDLFELGMDSLQAARLRRYLISAMASTDGASTAGIITRDFIYAHPSVSLISSALRGSDVESPGKTDLAAEVDRYVSEFAMPSKFAADRSKGKHVILLTGGTGSLGSHCLAEFASQPTIDRIICLNRASRKAPSTDSGKGRQESSFKDKGIDISKEQWSKIQVLETNTSLPLLGLSEKEYADLRKSVTHILHNAWPMDFNRQLSSFKTQFQSLQNLLALTKDICQVRPLAKSRLLFVSSVATVGRYSDACGGRIIPEIPIESLECVNGIGYAQAKLVCEKMVERAVKEHSEFLEATSLRFGQLSGSSHTGFWNTDEHFASLVKSSQRIKALPTLPGTFTWIPVDHAATVVSEILLAPERPSLVYHIDNPIRQSWSDALSIIGSDLGIEQSLPLERWLKEVCETTDTSPEANPAKKLEDFFRFDFERMACGHVVLGTDRARQVSPTLRNMDAVPGNVISSHIKYWRDVKFIK